MNRHAVTQFGVGLILFGAGLWFVPHQWCAREAGRWFDGDATLQSALARGVERWVNAELDRKDFSTGSAQFNGEWLFGTYVMAGLGFGQTATEHPEWRARHARLMSRCIERILAPEVRAFDRESWRNDPFETLDGDAGHAAYLGYLNILLSYQRWLDPASPHVPLNDRITAALVRRIERSPAMLLETYPSEVYPVDNCAVVGSIGLYDRATGADHRALIQRWGARCREKYVDRRSGLLIQAIHFANGAAADEPRGSGTTLGAYFLSFADPDLSRELHAAVRRELARTFFGFGAVREYPAFFTERGGDIDSGPIILGCSVSATGFCIGSSRIHGDRALFARLCATAHLFGAPLNRRDGRDYVTGGPLGNAILFAMLTAQPLREGTR